jgi:propane monooxygenase coupling protein
VTSTDSPFKQDSTASNMCGFTLMNNQIGAIMATVLDRQDNVTVQHLPSMIRVDGTGKFEVDYAEMDEEAGHEDGWFDAAEFEENMSTHYGKMIHMDDRTVMFGNLEEAAEFIGDMLPPEVK